jgi:hypothetical protein
MIRMIYECESCKKGFENLKNTITVDNRVYDDRVDTIWFVFCSPLCLDGWMRNSMDKLMINDGSASHGHINIEWSDWNGCRKNQGHYRKDDQG